MRWGEKRRTRKFPWTVLGNAVLILLILYFTYGSGKSAA